MKVDYLIQNKVSEEDFESTVYDWLSQGDYTPDDIIENIITEHNLMYFPVHFYKCSYSGNASASLGYPRIEYYYVYNPTTKRQERKSRTVTDWIPHAQNVSGNVSTAVYVGDLKFDFLKLLSLFKRNETDAWNNTGLKECHRLASKEIVNNFPSTIVRNFNANLSINVNNHASVVLPFWVFMYNYQGKPYYVAVDGNNPQRVSGLRPENKKRKNTVKAIRWVGWLSTIYLSYLGARSYYEANPYEDFKMIGVFIGIFAVLGFIIEGIVSYIKNASKSRRQEKLNNRKRLKAST